MSGIDIQSKEPESFFQGETIKWEKSLSDYPYSAGWTLKYYYSSPTEAFNVQATQKDDTEDYLVTVVSADTASKSADTYEGQAWVEKGSEKDMVWEGTLELKATLSGGAAVDTRSHVKKVLDAIEAVLESNATTDQQDLEVLGKKLKRATKGELMSMRSKYKAEYKSELAAEDIAAGLGTGQRIQTRFSG